MKIAPSILSADFGRLAEEVQRAEEGGADWIHVDVMDGHFVPNLTIGPGVTRAVRRATSLPVDVHLMIEAPERYLEAFADAGADRITVHQETCPHLHRTLEEIRRHGPLPGVALNPATPVAAVAEAVAHLDLVLIMSVNPGFGGQSYIPTSTDKIRRARALLDDVGRSGAELQVDGGVDAATAGPAEEAGATVLVAGSSIYGHPKGVEEAIRALRAAAAGAEART
ncbi:MAG: ribulose-phosphate 3-epimerase [Gemmatimonadetes bacterium]|nr:ribulose-phosphate 3-epimerase [Gemmatimonadota bacterium]NIR77871.1 ribulose-phosphate 3-epimerase [Gemmatimonadota bacterium]NIT86416.1 ribulose-phosphate 3-epimerase [Gemmatimonadota bacterium]NIU30253.1 ribulose-phosphate 3-epimerase [Gemmatimonadota bacterium]NIU35159.1 ribulose-phosphate 3-epimerase [Gemmatimonadota bacterium]